MREQRHCIDLVDWDYLIITDAGRYDVFAEIVDEFDAIPEGVPADNGGHAFTATWFADHLDGEYDMPFFHGGHPIWSFDTNPDDYDERDHFGDVPEYGDYEWDDELNVTTPQTVNAIVKRYAPQQAVIRYLQPHNPYRQLPDVHTKDDAKEYDPDVLREAYVDNYRWVLDAVEDLLPTLDGTVAITSDHGQCLGDCGQWLHHTTWDRHVHLTTVPWVVV